MLTMMSIISCGAFVEDFENGDDSSLKVDSEHHSTDSFSFDLKSDTLTSMRDSATASDSDTSTTGQDDTHFEHLDTGSDTTTVSDTDTPSQTEKDTLMIVEDTDSESEGTSATDVALDSATQSDVDSDSASDSDTQTDTGTETETGVALIRCDTLVISGATTVPSGLTQQLRASCDFDNGDLDVDVSSKVLWVSNDTEIVPQPTQGMVLGVTEGTATIRATYENSDGSLATDTHGITVTAGLLAAVRVSVDESPIPAGLSKQFAAYCDYTDRTDVLCTQVVLWESTNTDVATVNNDGLATTHQPGDALIFATLGKESDSVVLNVGDSILDSVTILATGATLEVNRTHGYSAKCYRTDGTSYSCGSAATWQSADETILGFPNKTYFQKGEAFAFHIGTTEITASVGNITSATKQVQVVVPAGCDGVLSFTDPDLEAVIRGVLGIPSANLHFEDVMDITSLSADYSYIDELTGIRCLTGLTSLSLYRNPGVVDATEISELAQLRDLNLGWSSIVEIPNLHLLTELESIYLQNTEKLKSINGLSYLPNLAVVNVGPSPLMDKFGIAALSTLDRLTTVSLVGVNVDDVSDLVSNSGIGSGDVLEFFVYDTAVCDVTLLREQLRTLQARNVAVTTNCFEL